MSLLMQALQKAAKERAGTEQAQSRSVPADELELEPIEAEPRLDSIATASKSSGAVGATPAQAAAVMQASAMGPGWVDWLRDHRKLGYGTLIGLAAVGYAVYFYLSAYHPAVFRRPFSAPVPAVAPPPALSRTAPKNQPSAAAEPPDTGKAATQANPSPPAAETDTPPRVPPARKALRRPTPNADDLAAPGTAVRPAMAPEPAAHHQPRDSISVKPGGEAPRVNPQLADAYDALRSGRTEEASRLYDFLLKSEPGNIDALLGRALAAQQQGDPDLATRHLFRVLELDPSNALAQGVLINLIGRADPQSAESKLKSLIAKDPSAFLYFSLGNLYADQGNWPAAQSAYFQAHHLARANPDYAFNLAVSLEHLSQPKLALTFYQQALELARVSGRAKFDTVAVRERIAKLAAGVE